MQLERRDGKTGYKVNEHSVSHDKYIILYLGYPNEYNSWNKFITVTNRD